MNSDKLKILIIDDDEVDQLSLKRAIKSSGFNAEIIAVTNSEDALMILDEQIFDCIFVDYNLPGTNGFEFLKKFRNIDNNTPVIVVTSHGDEQLAVEAMKLGACDYLPKSALNAEGISYSFRYIIKLRHAEINTNKVEKALVDTEKKIKCGY